MTNVKNFRADCIKDLKISEVTVCHNWKRYNVRMIRKGGECKYEVEDELTNYNNGQRLTLVEDEFSEYFRRVPNKLKVEFAAHFYTDGDYTIKKTDEMEHLTHALHVYARREGVEVEYEPKWDHDNESIEFHLKAEGEADSCRAIARELLEEMMCSIRTSRHYILIELINKLNGIYEKLTQIKDRDIICYDEMGGNYDGTEIALSVTEIEDDEDVTPLEDPKDTKTGWIEVAVPAENTIGAEGAECTTKLKCRHCGNYQPDNDYVRQFKHCPDCGKEI